MPTFAELHMQLQWNTWLYTYMHLQSLEYMDFTLQNATLWPSISRVTWSLQEGFGILTEADGTERQGFWLNGELLE